MPFKELGKFLKILIFNKKYNFFFLRLIKIRKKWEFHIIINLS